MNKDMYRLLSVVMTEAATRYRQGHYQEDIEDFRTALTNDIEMMVEDPRNKGLKKRLLGKVEYQVSEYKRKQDAISKALDASTNMVMERFPSEQSKERFDNYVAGVSLLVEEFINAKNTTEMLTLCRLYNQGLLDNVFENFKPKKDEDKNPIDESRSIYHDGTDSVRGIVQETNSGAAEHTEGTNEQSEQPGHIESGDVSNGELQSDGGAEHEPDHLP